MVFTPRETKQLVVFTPPETSEGLGHEQAFVMKHLNFEYIFRILIELNHSANTPQKVPTEKFEEKLRNYII